jgi:hypothetical protein
MQMKTDTKVFVGIVGVCVLLMIIAGAIGVASERRDEATTPMEPICTVNESTIDMTGGWRQVSTADRDAIAKLNAEGKAEIAYRPGTIVCTIWRNNSPSVDARGGLWYWRPRIVGAHA